MVLFSVRERLWERYSGGRRGFSATRRPNVRGMVRVHVYIVVEVVEALLGIRVVANVRPHTFHFFVFYEVVLVRRDVVGWRRQDADRHHQRQN
jgi:hypothetical protein